MGRTGVRGDKLKADIKAAVVEVLHEHPDLVREAVEEALEDAGLLRAIAEGRRSPYVSRNQVFKMIKGRPCGPSSGRRSPRTCAR